MIGIAGIIGIRKDKRGFSPIIGIILMVAVTVLLAGIISVYSFGLTSKLEKVPMSAIKVQSNDNMK